MVRGNITRLKTKVAKLEEKETVNEKEQQTASKMMKKLEDLTSELIMYHCAIVDPIEDQDKLTKEQAVLDNHEDKVEDTTERLVDRLLSM